MQLQLKRPLAFFDLETTGLSIIHDRLIEISILKVSPDGKEEQKTWRVNPGMAIPVQSIQFHGITDEDLKESPAFKDIAIEVNTFLNGCDLAGYNALKFDVPFLMEEFLRADVAFNLANRNIIDAQNIFMKMEPRTLKGAYRFFCNKELVNAHSAAADTYATFEILKAQIERYQDAVYDPKTQSITVSSRLIDSKIFAALSREIVHAGIHDHGRYPYYTREDCAMDAESVSYMLCRNFGVETPQPDVSRVGQVFDGMEVQDRRGVVDSLQKYFRKLQNDIQREISPQERKQPEQNRPVR